MRPSGNIQIRCRFELRIRDDDDDDDDDDDRRG
jgi:hypothetical protein